MCVDVTIPCVDFLHFSLGDYRAGLDYPGIPRVGILGFSLIISDAVPLVYRRRGKVYYISGVGKGAEGGHVPSEKVGGEQSVCCPRPSIKVVGQLILGN